MPTNILVPPLGESVTEAVLIRWIKKDGDSVGKNDPIAELETDKANVDLPAPAAGVIRHGKDPGATIRIGEVVGRIDDGNGSVTPTKSQQASAPASVNASAAINASDAAVPAGGAVALEDYSPAVRRLIEENHLEPTSIPPTGPNGRLTKEDVEGHLAERSALAKTAAPQPASRSRPPALLAKPPITSASPQPPEASQASAPPAGETSSDGDRHVPMSKLRKRIAERLVSAQQSAAILTTFNEVDLQALQELRGKYKDRFGEVHGISLGLMSFFSRAVVLALKEFPKINGSIEGDDVVYHDYVHLGIAVSTERGLTVPVLRHVERMSFAQIESDIKRLATAAKDGKLSLTELTGSTFTITNGGIFGSLLSTPIINPPESGILGMHTIQKRPMVVNDKIEIRPMMYLALSYDHRLIDGRESVSFLVRVKQYLEDPARMMLEV